MMSLYLDTGAILKLYIQEPGSDMMDAILTLHRKSLILTPLQLLETRTALRAKLFRREIDPPMLTAALKAIDTDVRDGLWEMCYPDQISLHQRANDISSRWVGTTGCRTLDLLHIAQAWELGAKKTAQLRPTPARSRGQNRTQNASRANA